MTWRIQLGSRAGSEYLCRMGYYCDRPGFLNLRKVSLFGGDCPVHYVNKMFNSIPSFYIVAPHPNCDVPKKSLQILSNISWREKLLLVENHCGRRLHIFPLVSFCMGFPGGSDDKESACNEGNLGSIPGLGRSHGEEKGYPFQYSGLENSMDCISPYGKHSLDVCPGIKGSVF